jgi:glycosyltransferase involved in cell wall biosynthesis
LESGRVANRPIVLLIGPTPPPYHGVAVATQLLMDSALATEFTLLHLDISDRRGIQHVNEPDLHDVLLFVRQWISLLTLLIRRRPRVAHIPISQSTVGFVRDSAFIWLAHLAGARIILHLHGGNFHAWYQACGTPVRAYARLVLNRVTRAIVLGESLRDAFAGLIESQRITVVPNGVAWPKEHASACATPKQRRYRVLYLGTVNRPKGALAMLAAIPLVEAIRRDVEFVFAGPWSHVRDREEAESSVDKWDIRDAVAFVGPVEGEHKRAWFESADLFVFPALQQEGQPLVVLEAMAAGLPVLYTDRGCIRETVADAGIEVTADPDMLAERILWLLDRPAEMTRLGAAAKQRYELYYTHERFVERMTRVFDDALVEAT